MMFFHNSNFSVFFLLLATFGTSSTRTHAFSIVPRETTMINPNPLPSSQLSMTTQGYLEELTLASTVTPTTTAGAVMAGSQQGQPSPFHLKSTSFAPGAGQQWIREAATTSYQQLVVTTTTTTNTKTKKIDNPIFSIQQPHDLLNFLMQNDNELCIVKVWAPWCKACKQLEPKYKQLAQKYYTTKNPTTTTTNSSLSSLSSPKVRFAEIEYKPNQELCHELKATKLPHIIVYQKMIKQDQFVCLPKDLKYLTNLITSSSSQGGNGDVTQQQEQEQQQEKVHFSLTKNES